MKIKLILFIFTSILLKNHAINIIRMRRTDKERIIRAVLES